MTADDEFSNWAAQFLKIHAGDDAELPDAEPAGDSTLTLEACDLLRAVDRGGVPAFMTMSLKKIAEENGVEVSEHTTPNDIVAAIRSKAAC